jgi:hypothetical protein
VHGQAGQDDGRERQGDDLQRVQQRPDPQKPGKGEGDDKEKENRMLMERRLIFQVRFSS